MHSYKYTKLSTYMHIYELLNILLFIGKIIHFFGKIIYYLKMKYNIIKINFFLKIFYILILLF